MRGKADQNAFPLGDVGSSKHQVGLVFGMRRLEFQIVDEVGFLKGYVLFYNRRLFDNFKNVRFAGKGSLVFISSLVSHVLPSGL